MSRSLIVPMKETLGWITLPGNTRWEYQLRRVGFDETKNMIAFYKFNGNATDETGLNGNGTVNGSTTFPAFGTRQVAYFPGASPSRISIPDISKTTMSFSVWVKFSLFSSPQYLATMPLGSYSGVSYVWTRETNLWITNTSESQIINTSSNPVMSLNDNQFHHLVFTEQSGLSQIYYDGSLIKRSSINSTFVINSVGQACTGYWFNGHIGNLRVYDQAIDRRTVEYLWGLEREEFGR